jgi:hypothetical protein
MSGPFYFKRKTEGDREGSKEQRRSDAVIWEMRRNIISVLENSQASPARPSGIE